MIFQERFLFFAVLLAIVLPSKAKGQTETEDDESDDIEWYYRYNYIIAASLLAFLIVMSAFIFYRRNKGAPCCGERDNDGIDEKENIGWGGSRQNSQADQDWFSWNASILGRGASSRTKTTCNESVASDSLKNSATCIDVESLKKYVSTENLDCSDTVQEDVTVTRSSKKINWSNLELSSSPVAKKSLSFFSDNISIESKPKTSGERQNQGELDSMKISFAGNELDAISKLIEDARDKHLIDKDGMKSANSILEQIYFSHMNDQPLNESKV